MKTIFVSFLFFLILLAATFLSADTSEHLTNPAKDFIPQGKAVLPHGVEPQVKPAADRDSLEAESPSQVQQITVLTPVELLGKTKRGKPIISIETNPIKLALRESINTLRMESQRVQIVIRNLNAKAPEIMKRLETVINHNKLSDAVRSKAVEVAAIFSQTEPALISQFRQYLSTLGNESSTLRAAKKPLSLEALANEASARNASSTHPFSQLDTLLAQVDEVFLKAKKEEVELPASFGSAECVIKPWECGKESDRLRFKRQPTHSDVFCKIEKWMCA